MKKIVIAGACIVSVYCVYGMEEQAGFRQQLYSTKGSTIIYLTKDEIYNRQYSQYPDISVAGLYKQRSLQEPDSGWGNCFVVGSVYSIQDNITTIKNKQIESDSEDDSYYSARPDGGILCNKNGIESVIKQPWDYTEKKIVPGKLIAVVEPKVFFSDNGYRYYKADTFMGNQATTEAQKDLEFCYSNVLEKAHTKFTDDKKRTIAFPSLGIGIPKKEASYAAVAAVLKFIKKDPNKYDSIEFVTKNKTEFNLYKALLDKQLTNITAAINNVYTHISLADYGNLRRRNINK